MSDLITVAIKSLEWVEIRTDQYYEARVIGILYSVGLGTDGVARWQAGHMGVWRDAHNLEAAKAAAQADYDARIRSQIIVAQIAVKPGKIERAVWSAMIWAIDNAPRSGAVPEYTDGGNSHAEVECRAAAARIRSAVNVAPGPDPEAEAARLREALDHDAIAKIEAGGKRWHGTAPESYRWEPYKPDGQRQMRAKGRWQRMVWYGDFFKWENCQRPEGLMSGADQASSALSPRQA